MNEKIITYKKLINDEISKIHFSDKPKNLYEPLKYILSLKRPLRYMIIAKINNENKTAEV